MRAATLQRTAVDNGSRLPAILAQCQPERGGWCEQLGSSLSAFASTIAADGLVVAQRASQGHTNKFTLYGDCSPEDGHSLQSMLIDYDGPPTRWLVPFNLRGDAMLTTRLACHDGSVVKLGFSFSRGKVLTRAAVEMALCNALPLLGHLIDMAARNEALDAMARGCRAALDRCEMGVLLLGGEGTLIYASRAAQNLLDEGLAIRRAGSSIAACELMDAARLRVAIEHVSHGAVGARARMPMLTLQRGRNRRPLLVSIIAPERPALCDDDATAILYILDPESDSSRMQDGVMRLYGLSPVEAGLASHLVCGASLAEAAVALKIKEMTARSYLKQIFLKTGVNRQAALIRLLMASVIRLSPDVEPQVISHSPHSGGDQDHV